MSIDRQNSNADELKRRRRSILGKIKRRQGTISLLRHDLWELEAALNTVDRQLTELKGKG